jgi:hypothetical protein
MGRAALLLTALTMALARPAGAQEAPRWQVHVNPYVGLLVFDDSELKDIGREVNIGPLLGGRVTIPLAPAWWVEGAYGFAWLSTEASEFQGDPGEPERDLGVHLFYAAIDYLISSRDLPTRLLLSAGAGAIVLSPEEGDADADLLATLGVGFIHPVSTWINFRGDLKDHIQFCSSGPGNEFRACLDNEALNNFEVSGGLQFRLR